MSEQYILLRKENDLLNSIIGQSFNQKSKFEAEKILNEIHSKAKNRLIGKKALCYVIDNSEIKGVGGSTLMKDKKTGEITSNLILDQFGILLTGLFKKEDLLFPSTSLNDDGNVSRSIFPYGGSGANPWNLFASNNLGMSVQVGSGITTPDRTDFNIETVFGTSPESVKFSAASNPVWGSGNGNFKYAATISAGGSGTINESVLFLRARDTASALRFFTLFRDSISPGVAFVISQTISLEYTIQL